MLPLAGKDCSIYGMPVVKVWEARHLCEDSPGSGLWACDFIGFTLQRVAIKLMVVKLNTSPRSLGS